MRGNRFLKCYVCFLINNLHGSKASAFNKSNISVKVNKIEGILN